MTRRSADTSLTVVMYHLVQPPEAGPVHGLKALDPAAFRDQLAYVLAHYTPIAVSDLIDAVEGASTLPPRAILLTFDDGYRCHYRDVAPLLEARRVPAVFFPVAAAALDRRVLDVNKIQCILASTSDASALASRVDAEVDRRRSGTGVSPVAELRARWWTSSRWDPAPIAYVKQLLQHALPHDVRRPIVDALFAEHVSTDERSFADELYMNVDELRELRTRGMTIGAHGDRHLRLPTLTDEEQRREVEGALRVLDASGASRSRFAYSYANGAHDRRAIALLRRLGCAVAFTTEPDIARRIPAEPLALPRLDTNDLPTHAHATPNEWTRRAAEPS